MWLRGLTSWECLLISISANQTQNSAPPQHFCDKCATHVGPTASLLQSYYAVLQKSENLEYIPIDDCAVVNCNHNQ